MDHSLSPEPEPTVQVTELLLSLAFLRERERRVESEICAVVDKLLPHMSELRKLCGFNHAAPFVKKRWLWHEARSAKRDVLCTLARMSLYGLTVTDFVLARSDYFSAAAYKLNSLKQGPLTFPESLRN